ncbi:unnamed protein product [Spodoptera littoralis]|uniref:Uncharacterized protein n=1 Tax=Spodoptera littoralis TaxID=7109 RepID=A0A9P0I4Z7_SPOLI|nr:unnamed protein product [Spodoptera littoralis]CAH1641492.1 unnamed protein product [Spodoptera littoralis]
MRTLKDHLAVIAQNQSRVWITKLELQCTINSTKSKATGFSPLELLIGKLGSVPAVERMCVLSNPIDRDTIRAYAVIRMTEQSSKNKERFDSKCAKLKLLQPGDFVVYKDAQRSSNKLDPKYLGPYQIVKTLDNDRYELRSLSPGQKKNRNISRITYSWLVPQQYAE